MGILTEFIQRKLTDEVNEKGLVVWLDKSGEFTPIVDQWAQAHLDGKFPFPVFGFRGSFLELMVVSRSVLATKDAPRCLLHMPGFNEVTIKQTPLNESYQAGKRLRASLGSLVREFAQGRLTPDQVDYLLSHDPLDLEVLEREFQGFQDAPDEIKKLLNHFGEDGLVLAFLKDPGGVSAELAVHPSARFGLLFHFFERLLGLDSQWLQDWNDIDPAMALPKEQAEALAAYLLCLEFASDLTTEAPSPRLKRLREKIKTYKTRGDRLLLAMRRSQPELFARWAAQVERLLTPDETGLTPQALGDIDTFPFEADLFLKDAMTSLAASRWNEGLLLAQMRLPKKDGDDLARSFWIGHDAQRGLLWQWIEAAGELGTQTQKASGLAGAKDVEVWTLAQEYAREGWELDQLHRRFSVLTERVNAASTVHVQEFVSVRKTLGQLYRTWVDSQARAWNRACENHGFLGPVESRQRKFYAQFVKPHLDRKEQTAVVFVDALRFELGRELADLINTEDWGKVVTQPLLAELPTITAVGMNALIPTSADGTLRPLVDLAGRAVVGFQAGERQVTSPDSRQRTLAEVAGVEVSWSTVEDFLKADPKQTKKLTSVPLVVLTTQEIDAMGEGGALVLGFDYFENGLGRVKMAVRKLKENGCDAVVLVADHGFLLGDETLENNKAPKLSSPDRRYALDTPRTSESLVSVGFGALDYKPALGDPSVVFERSTHLLSARKAGSFYHGGNTPQERVIPVLTLASSRPPTPDRGQYRLGIEKLPSIGDLQRLKVSVERIGVPELFTKNSLELRFAADAGTAVLVAGVTGSKFVGDLFLAELDTVYEIAFTLKGPTAKSRIRFESTQAGNELQSALCQDYFDVQVTVAAGPAPAVADTIFPATIPSEYHAALKHLDKHGSLTEKFLANTMGAELGPRKARQFANNIQEWTKLLPFNIKIEMTAEGKTYRKQ